MIQIRFQTKSSDLCSMTITGHANSGPYGQDLVCCAVSAIALSSLNAIDELFPDACQLSALDNRISLVVDHNCEALQTSLQTIEKQLLALALQYPDYIKMETSSIS